MQHKFSEVLILIVYLAIIFTLVRPGTDSIDRDKQERWLLIKQRDEHVDPSWNVESPRLAHSVLTGRSLKEIEQIRSEGKSRRVRTYA